MLTIQPIIVTIVGPHFWLDQILINASFCGSNNIDLAENKRVCSHCGKLMNDGYVFYDGEAYYCSDECLDQHFSEAEYIRAFNSDDAYWTEWQ